LAAEDRSSAKPSTFGNDMRSHHEYGNTARRDLLLSFVAIANDNRFVAALGRDLSPRAARIRFGTATRMYF
jgi:hypothetical protein